MEIMNEIFGQMKQRAQAMWSSGDYSMIGVAFVLVSEQLCETIKLHAGQKVPMWQRGLATRHLRQHVVTVMLRVSTL
jgi:hypothetical protein